MLCTWDLETPSRNNLEHFIIYGSKHFFILAVWGRRKWNKFKGPHRDEMVMTPFDRFTLPADRLVNEPSEGLRGCSATINSSSCLYLYYFRLRLRLLWYFQIIRLRLLYFILFSSSSSSSAFLLFSSSSSSSVFVLFWSSSSSFVFMLFSSSSSA